MTRHRGGAPIPWPIAVPAGIGLGFLTLPLAALLVRAPWTGLGTALGTPEARAALRLSLLTATTATAVCALSLIHI